jgi:hypothetical protein
VNNHQSTRGKALNEALTVLDVGGGGNGRVSHGVRSFSADCEERQTPR